MLTILNEFLPEMQYYYRDPYSSNFIGNPHLDYEQTVLYEFGFTNQFLENWSIDVKSYAKDISQQVGTTTIRSGQTGGVYDNNGYARARGLEFRIEKHHTSYFSGNLNYTIQWATGYTSSAFEDYIYSDKYEFEYIDDKVEASRFNYIPDLDIWELRSRLNKYFLEDKVIKVEYFFLSLNLNLILQNYFLFIS